MKFPKSQPITEEKTGIIHNGYEIFKQTEANGGECFIARSQTGPYRFGSDIDSLKALINKEKKGTRAGGT